MAKYRPLNLDVTAFLWQSEDMSTIAEALPDDVTLTVSYREGTCNGIISSDYTDQEDLVFPADFDGYLVLDRDNKCIKIEKSDFDEAYEEMERVGLNFFGRSLYPRREPEQDPNEEVIVSLPCGCTSVTLPPDLGTQDDTEAVNRISESFDKSDVLPVEETEVPCPQCGRIRGHKMDCSDWEDSQPVPDTGLMQHIPTRPSRNPSPDFTVRTEPDNVVQVFMNGPDSM